MLLLSVPYLMDLISGIMSFYLAYTVYEHEEA